MTCLKECCIVSCADEVAKVLICIAWGVIPRICSLSLSGLAGRSTRTWVAMGSSGLSWSVKRFASKKHHVCLVKVLGPLWLTECYPCLCSWAFSVMFCYRSWSVVPSRSSSLALLFAGWRDPCIVASFQLFFAAVPCYTITRTPVYFFYFSVDPI